MANDKCCLLCGSRHNITFHHLIPRTCHSNKWFKKRYTTQQMREDGIDICRKCHSYLHKKFSEKELGRELNTLEKIRANEVMAAYVEWARKHLV